MNLNPDRSEACDVCTCVVEDIRIALVMGITESDTRGRCAARTAARAPRASITQYWMRSSRKVKKGVRDVSRARALRLAGDAPRRLARVRASEETKATRE
eukprot:1392099-Amorphochlora_amoeboformis.AAC.1